MQLAPGTWEVDSSILGPDFKASEQKPGTQSLAPRGTPSPWITSFTRPSDWGQACLALAKLSTSPSPRLDTSQAKSGSGPLIGQPMTSDWVRSISGPSV